MKKKNQSVELLIFNEFFSPVLGWQKIGDIEEIEHQHQEMPGITLN